MDEFPIPPRECILLGDDFVKHVRLDSGLSRMRQSPVLNFTHFYVKVDHCVGGFDFGEKSAVLGTDSLPFPGCWYHERLPLVFTVTSGWEAFHSGLRGFRPSLAHRRHHATRRCADTFMWAWIVSSLSVVGC